MIEQVKKSTIHHIIGAISASVITLIATLVPLVFPPLIVTMGESVGSQLACRMLLVSISGNLILLATVYYLKNRNKLLPKLGLFWDSRQNAYCPACKSLLTAYASYQKHGHGFKCIQCDKVVSLRNSYGENIKIEEALRLLKKESK